MLVVALNILSILKTHVSSVFKNAIFILKNSLTIIYSLFYFLPSLSASPIKCVLPFFS